MGAIEGEKALLAVEEDEFLEREEVKRERKVDKSKGLGPELLLDCEELVLLLLLGAEGENKGEERKEDEEDDEEVVVVAAAVVLDRESPRTRAGSIEGEEDEKGERFAAGDEEDV